MRPGIVRLVSSRSWLDTASRGDSVDLGACRRIALRQVNVCEPRFWFDGQGSEFHLRRNAQIFAAELTIDATDAAMKSGRRAMVVYGSRRAPFGLVLLVSVVIFTVWYGKVWYGMVISKASQVSPFVSTSAFTKEDY